MPPLNLVPNMTFLEELAVRMQAFHSDHECVDDEVMFPLAEGEKVVEKLNQPDDTQILDGFRRGNERMREFKVLVGRALPLLLEATALKDEAHAKLRSRYPKVARALASGAGLLFRRDGDTVVLVKSRATDMCPSR